MNQMVTEAQKTTSTSCCVLILLVIRDLNTHNDADNSKDDEEYNEADPSLFTGSPCGVNGLLRVAKTKDTISSGSVQAVQGLSPSLHVLLDFASLSLDNIDGLILLLNQDAHLMF